MSRPANRMFAANETTAMMNRVEDDRPETVAGALDCWPDLMELRPP